VSIIRGYSQLPEDTASDIGGQLARRMERLRKRLAKVRHTVAIVSGKGGVGKSAIAANLAVRLASEGLAVGVLDADLNGPSAARLLGVRGAVLQVSDDQVEPATGAAGVKVMSMDLLLASEESPVAWSGPKSESFLWRGTLEANALREFLADTAWGELDYLVIDVAPGADRIAPVHDLIPDLGGAVVITIPSSLSRAIVSKSVTMLGDRSIDAIGYVVNMAGYLCPDCGGRRPLFKADQIAFDGIARLAELPFDPEFGAATDAGRPGVLEWPDSLAAQAIAEVAGRVRMHMEG
jgi:ATP-binding protein involved in chromosome partitioning